MFRAPLAAAYRANRRKPAILAGVALLYLGGAIAVTSRYLGLPVAAIAGVVVAALAGCFYLLYGRILFAGLRPIKVTSREDPEAIALLLELVERAGLRHIPTVVAVNEAGINSFAAGSGSGARILVTDGLLDLVRPELDAAIAREVVHLAAGDTIVDRLAFALTGWVLLPAAFLLEGLFQLESFARTAAARGSNIANGLGVVVVWPIYAVIFVAFAAAVSVVQVVALPARLADMIAIGGRERRADQLAAAASAPEATAHVIRMAALTPGWLRASRVAGKIALVETRPRERWWREVYVLRPSPADRQRRLGFPAGSVAAGPMAARAVQGAPAVAGTLARDPFAQTPEPGAAPGAAALEGTSAGLETAAAGASVAAEEPASEPGVEPTRRQGLMLIEKILYTVAGVILGAALAAAFFLLTGGDEAAEVVQTATPTPLITATASPTATRTARPTRTPSPTGTPTVASPFEVGEEVMLTNGTGNCLQTYSRPTFKSTKVKCETDLTKTTLTEGPFAVDEDAGSFVWWRIESGAYIIEKWIR